MIENQRYKEKKEQKWEQKNQIRAQEKKLWTLLESQTAKNETSRGNEDIETKSKHETDLPSTRSGSVRIKISENGAIK